MNGQGTLANIAAAICSFFIPGLGQLVQGRPWAALFQFVLTALLWLVLLGWIMHLWSILDAAWYKSSAHREANCRARYPDWQYGRYRYE